MRRAQATDSAANAMPPDPDPFVGNDARRDDRSHRAFGILAYDSVNANAWKESIKYLEATGTDAVFLQGAKVPAGQHQDEADGE